jgi:hypothetical protein
MLLDELSKRERALSCVLKLLVAEDKSSRDVESRVRRLT